MVVAECACVCVYVSVAQWYRLDHPLSHSFQPGTRQVCGVSQVLELCRVSQRVEIHFVDSEV